MEDGRIFIVSTMDIPAGGEVTFDYGYDLQDYPRASPAAGGSANCAGYIVAGECFTSICGQGMPIFQSQRNQSACEQAGTMVKLGSWKAARTHNTEPSWRFWRSWQEVASHGDLRILPDQGFHLGGSSAPGHNPLHEMWRAHHDAHDAPPF